MTKGLPKETVAYWRRTYPKTTSKTWRKGIKVQYRSRDKLEGTVVEVRSAHNATLLTGTPTGIKMSGIGKKKLNILVKTNEGYHLGSPRDLRRVP
jgi:hypothetical protein